MTPLDNIRIAQTRPLLAPLVLIEEIPLTKLATAVIEKGRKESSAILRGDDDRLCVVCGPARSTTQKQHSNMLSVCCLCAKSIKTTLR